MLELPNPSQNQLLAHLPPEVYKRTVLHLDPVSLSAGQSILEGGARIQHAFFPTTSVISLLYCSPDGGSSTISIVGNEGMVGISLLMGGVYASMSCLVQGGGAAFRIAAARLQDEFQRGGALQRLLLRYVQARWRESIQAAYCFRHHPIEQQLCRWLLASLDRQASSQLAMTQEQIAALLGVRREAVTEAAGRLQKAGWIRYRRGHITIVDRAGLEGHVCACHRVIKGQFAGRLQPGWALDTLDSAWLQEFHARTYSSARARPA